MTLFVTGSDRTGFKKESSTPDKYVTVKPGTSAGEVRQREGRMKTARVTLVSVVRRLVMIVSGRDRSENVPKGGLVTITLGTGRRSGGRGRESVAQFTEEAWMEGEGERGVATGGREVREWETQVGERSLRKREVKGTEEECAERRRPCACRGMRLS